MVHKSFALSALHGFHRACARHNARYTRSDTAPTFGVHVRGATLDACPRNAVRGGYDFSQGGHLTEFNRPFYRERCSTVKRSTSRTGYRTPHSGCLWGVPPWSVSIVHLGASHVNPFFQKIFGGNFFSFFFDKVTETIYTREKIFSEKTRKNIFFGACCAPIFENSAPCRAPTAPRPDRQRDSG